MYYHIRLGKFKHGGGEDVSARKAWDFRSLDKAFAFVKRDFGSEAEAWRIEDLTERKNDLMTLEKVLADALESGYQYLIMSFKDGSALAQKYDHYQFFVTTRDEGEDPAAFSFSEEEEAAITAPETIFQPDYRQSIRDILKSFDLEERYPEFLDKTAAAVAEYCGDEPDDPDDVCPVRIKDPMSAAEDIELADEYRGRGEDQIAVMLYLGAIGGDGPDVKIGEALAKMAELYLDSNLPKGPGRERDVMKAVDLLVEAVRRGYGDAKHIVESLREQLFVWEDRFGDEYDDDEMLDVDDVIKRYELDEVCFAGFCVCSGLGWARNMDNAEKLFEHALDNGYERASYYLNEIRAERAWDCLWS